MTRRVLHLQLAAVGVALILAAIPGSVGRAQTPRPVSVDGDDIGGVVTGPNGPEAGVWVIAETTDLPDASDQERRHRRSGSLPHPRPAEGEPTTCGSAATVWSIRRRSRRRPGKPLHADGGGGAEPESGRGVLPGTVLAVAPAGAAGERFPRHRSDRQRHLAQHARARASGFATSSTPTAAPAAIRWATRRRARFPRTLGKFDALVGGVGSAHPVGTGRRAA